MIGSNVGVDVGSTGVRAVQVSKARGKRPKIIRAVEMPLDRGIVVGGEVQSIGDLTLALRDLWRLGRFTSRNVTFGMSGQQTLVRQVDLPWEPPDVFHDSLPLRVGGDLPVDPREMTIDSYPLSMFERGPAFYQRALVVAAMNVSVENAADAMKSAKLRVNRADYSPFALIRAAVAIAGDGSAVPEAPQPGEERPVEVVVDVGAQMTIIAVHDNGRPLFVRVVALGSEAVTRAIAGQLQLRFEEAEHVKRSLGIQGVGSGEPSRELLGFVPPQQIQMAQQIVNVMASALVQAVRESIDYFLSASDSASSISRVLLSGGGAMLPGYGERLASELRAPVRLLMPMASLSRGRAKKSANLDPRLAVAFGLALEVKG